MNACKYWQLLANSLEAQKAMARYDLRLKDPDIDLKILICHLKARGLELDAPLRAAMIEMQKREKNFSSFPFQSAKGTPS
jgi:hypothetical protein